MARISSVIEFTGRVGNLVGAKGQDGEYLLRKHQPQVKNPNSWEQISHRCKISLSASLASLIPSDVLYGMKGSGRRGRRQRWLHEIIKRMSTTVSDGTVTALLAPSDLLLSEGPFASGVTMSGIIATGGNIEATVTFPEEVDRVVVVSLYAKERNSGFLATKSTVVTESGTVTIPFPSTNFRVANLYIIPIRESRYLSGVSYSGDVVASGEEMSYSSEAVAYNAGRYEWMHSEYVGSYTASA